MYIIVRTLVPTPIYEYMRVVFIHTYIYIYVFLYNLFWKCFRYNPYFYAIWCVHICDFLLLYFNFNSLWPLRFCPLVFFFLAPYESKKNNFGLFLSFLFSGISNVLQFIWQQMFMTKTKLLIMWLSTFFHFCII